MRLDVASWKEFKLCNLFDRLESGLVHDTSVLDVGDEVPYIGAKRDNNGVIFHCTYNPAFVQLGNCVLFICDGQGSVGYANYMDSQFIATVNVVAGYLDIMTPAIGLFLATVISLERPKYSFGRKWKTHLRDTEVKLPVQHNADGTPIFDCTKKWSDDGYVPDWQFMEDYIKSLYHKPLTTKNNIKNILALNVEKWKEFRFGDLILDSDIYKAKAINKDDLTIASDTTDSIRYITRTAEDNGCELLAVRSELPASIIEDGNAISIGDTTATCFYQDKEFIAGDHIVVVRANSWLNKYTGLFIVAMLQREQYKYSYGRAYLMDRIKGTFVKLPADDNGNPDWQFIENYIKSLPYGDRLEG